MTVKVHDYKKASSVIPARVAEEVRNAIVAARPSQRAPQLRDEILTALRNFHGWSDRVSLSSDAKISITSKKSNIGLCLQTGNMGRFYADLIKLEFLHKQGIIASAIYIIPTLQLALRLGENIANYERFCREVTIFSTIINIPLLIMGFSEN